MQVPVLLVPIRRGPMFTHQAEVGAHELRVLEAIHGQGVIHELIEPHGEGTMRELDDLGAEFERLESLYGRDDSGAAFVTLAYPMGPRQMAEEIEKMTAPPKSKRTKAAE